MHEEGKKSKSNWKLVLRYYYPFAKKYKNVFFVTFLTYSIGSVLDGTAAPFFYRIIIDKISNFIAVNGSKLPLLDTAFSKEIFGLVGLIAFIFVMTRVCYSLGDYMMSRFQSQALRDTANFSFTKTIGHSYQFFINSFAGSLVKKTGRFTHSFEEIADIVFYQLWLPVVQLLTVYIVLFFVAPVIGALFFVWSIFFIGFAYRFAKRRTEYDLAEAAADSITTGQTADVFTNVLNLKMFASTAREIKSFYEVTTKQMKARDKAWSFQNFTFVLQGSIITWLSIASLYISVSLWIYGYITLGTIVLAYTYSGIIFNNVWNMGRQMSRLSKAFSNAAEMVDILETKVEILDPVAPQDSVIKKGEIVFDDVDFSYKHGAPVLSNYKLMIEPGEKVGVVGTSGAGKTTITKLLLRFADVTGGAIRIDGQDIRAITQDDLRRAISYVPQDPVLFHRTLSENIAYGKTKAKQSEIESAAKLAHAHDFIGNLSHGYDTLVGERGVKLSGGERQRVAIARAILKNAPILILDEATSSLDSVSETHIKEALDTLMQGRTTIVIAHRLSTIEKMDRIIVMERGKIVEEGNHKALIKKRGTYYKFWKHQNGGFIE